MIEKINDNIVRDIKHLIESENKRQKDTVSLIASENRCSDDVRLALGSCLTDKYAEGYPYKRYYSGCGIVDEIENIAINTACKLFDSTWANVQPHSGSQANQAVFTALLNTNDTILGMSLAHGGHLSHGAAVHSSGKMYKSYHYGVGDDGIIDMSSVKEIALQIKPKLIIAGASSYSRIIDWASFRAIADEVNAYLLCDIAHYSGLIAAGVYPTPLPYAHVVTSTTHKTLRGPRGGLIILNEKASIKGIEKRVDSAVFPGVQGGPMMHAIAAKGICFAEALNENFKDYARQVISNARCMANTLIDLGWKIVSGGTDCHMFVIDLNSKSNLNGQEAADILEAEGIIVSKSCIPNDLRPPIYGSGIRIGTASATSLGMNNEKAIELAHRIHQILFRS